MGSKIISFSLWGDNPKYTVGAIRNAELAKQIYPDWICRFYLGQSVPDKIVWLLEAMQNVELVHKPVDGDWTGMFWRFEPASEEDVEVMISRDTDSRLNMREKAAVEEWLKSDKRFHIMRDHPFHKFPVLGGMWGAKKGCLPNMKTMIDNFSQQNAYGTDYVFFSERVLPSLDQNDIMIHDEFFGGSPFPVKRDGLEFVGQVFDQEENFVTEHSIALQEYLKNV